MKKLTKSIIAMLAIGLISMTASAKSKTKVTLIPHANIGLSNLGSSFTNESENSNVTKPMGQNILVGGGLEAKFALTKQIGVQTGLNFMSNNLGTKYSKSGTVLNTTTTIESTMTYSSLEIPVLMTFDINTFTLEAGPYVSVPLGKLNQKGSTSIKLNNNDPAVSNYSSATDLNTKLNFGFLVGGDWKKKISGGTLVLGARYITDFSPTQSVLLDSEGKKVEDSEGDLFTRRGLLFNAGFSFAL